MGNRASDPHVPDVLNADKFSNPKFNIELDRYVKPGLTKQDVSNIFLVFTNLQDEADAPDEVKLQSVKGLPFFQNPETLYVD